MNDYTKTPEIQVGKSDVILFRTLQRIWAVALGSAIDCKTVGVFFFFSKSV